MAGIYLHIPFCKQRCTYCDFHFSTNFDSYKERMILAIGREIQERAGEIQEPIQTIYFGGGTPSLLSDSQLLFLIDKIHELFTVEPGCEITLEANPDDILIKNLLAWRNSGINRLSIGLQSFRSSDLLWMNRAHSVEDSLKCVPLAQDHGFTNLSVDLMYGLPNLSQSEWLENINKVMDFGVPHVSAYCLTIEERTALDKKVNKGEIVPMGEEDQSQQFDLLLKTLTSHGFEQYEISNFCRDEKYAVHNTAYWKGANYLGVGPSAHSFNGTERRFNVANNTQYMKGIDSGSPIFEKEKLTDTNRFNERIMTGLRTKWGLAEKDLVEIMPLSVSFEKRKNEFIQNNWLLSSKGILLLTQEGKLRADYISAELFQ